jgi:hypothetical protein
MQPALYECGALCLLVENKALKGMVSFHCIYVGFSYNICGLHYQFFLNIADMKCSMLGITLAVAIAAVLTTQAAGESKRPKLFMLEISLTKTFSVQLGALMCYYSSWSYVRPGRGNFDVENIDPNLCTHLIYAFIGANWDGTVRVMDAWNDLEEDFGKGRAQLVK